MTTTKTYRFKKLAVGATVALVLSGGATTVLLPTFATAASASQGADDPAGHVRHSADDAVGQVLPSGAAPSPSVSAATPSASAATPSVAAPSASVSCARNGADDPVGHVRHGDDDGVGHLRHGGDDSSGHGGHGADDSSGHN